MSAAGISSSGIFNFGDMLSAAQKLQTDFQQLGKDLQSGSLTAAQSDLSAFNQDAAVFTPSAGTQGGSSPIDKAFQQLEQDVQGGKLSAAQQDYATIQDLQGGTAPNSVALDSLTGATPGSDGQGQGATTNAQGPGQPQSETAQSQGTSGHRSHNGRHHGDGAGGGSGDSEVAQLMSQLGQALQSGNLGAAQQAYSSLSQDLGQNSQHGLSGQGSGQSTPATTGSTGTNGASESVLFVTVNIDISI